MWPYGGFMGSQPFLRVLFASFVALTISACSGGGGEASIVAGSGGTGTGGTGGGTGGGTTTPTVAPRLGVLNAGVFSADVVEIGVSPLANGGSSGLRVNVVDTANGNTLITDEVTVTFSSDCATGGTGALAVIDPVSPVTTTGTATSTYRAQGCSGDDRVRATATVGGTALSALGSINVLPASLGAIEFVSAIPTTIGLRGSGQSETSTVVFRVTNNSGGPIPGQTVDFSLNTTVGGLSITPASGITDSNGQVSATVSSGSVLTSVRVTAQTTRDGVTISSQSEQLTVSTAIPDQDSFSLSAESLNVEGWSIDGTTVPITIRMADRYNNPVPDGTAVTFTTEGGRIDSTCFTAGGECSVNWVSQDPRPQIVGSDEAGRSTILAFAVGEESFSDADGDGLFDPGEFSAVNDLPEAFLDRDADGVRDSSNPVEEIFDFNQNGSYDSADGKFNGLLCDGDGNGTLALCAEPRTLHVRSSLVLIMSQSQPTLDLASDISTVPAGAYDGAGSITGTNSGSVRIIARIRDANNQPMPVGTGVAFKLFGDGELQGTTSFTVPNTNASGGTVYSVIYKAPTLASGDANASDLVEITVTSPSGLITTQQISISVAAPP